MDLENLLQTCKTSNVDTDFLEPALGYCALGMYEDATDILDGLTREQHAHPQVTALRLKIFVQMQDYESAVFYGGGMCLLHPEMPVLRELTAQSYLELGEPEAAKEFLRAPPAPMDAACLYLLCLAEVRLGHPEEAKAALKRCLAKDRSYKSRALEDLRLDSIWMGSGV